MSYNLLIAMASISDMDQDISAKDIDQDYINVIQPTSDIIACQSELMLLINNL